MTRLRVGIGYDVHKLTKGRKLILGGVTVPFTKGLEGHSDADVVIHAIIDAIIGATGEHDIGFHFPSDDPRYKGVSSLKLLKEIGEILKARGFSIVNIDSTIEAQKPVLSPYAGGMCSNIAAVLEIPKGKVNVKLKTPEGLGYVGKGQGMAAYAVCLIEKAA
ncbi:MAG: 2-C-methyl-D-erythritol 2,4-cyclodiphosphate synthase [Candidatus Saganbacteria bacterium]|nr:2-C-methyl-D-erythritol 2,4-cyclodiphosphate synthase [Candidatus Saganbacteria bacterium]